MKNYRLGLGYGILNILVVPALRTTSVSIAKLLETSMLHKVAHQNSSLIIKKKKRVVAKQYPKSNR